VIFLGVVLLGVALTLLAVIPKTNAAMKAHKRLVVTLVSVYLVLVVLHPYIFGLPGRIAEMRFQMGLRRGLTRAEIIRLAQKYKGTGPFGTGLDMTEPVWDWRSEGAVHIQFVDWSTLCIVGGKDYAFYFSPNWRLTEWKVAGWGNAC
jgi:hypothetical protein